ncbi:DAK2 domain-containing protein [Cryptosporangium arvum]|uniref:DAK2 domain-containing protein n=1 Tax=Cryptosporangium arvum TaxID=80871 RepID=UPI0004AC7E9B|nr:DAK2 domain-containing protein [Cryptosporangium arvum]
MRDRLDAESVRRWFVGTLAALRRRQPEIDALNVFPVADSDTGTNLVLTLQAAVDADAGGATVRDVWTAMARGALLGARGNSGMIVSQLLAGAADALPGDASVRGRALATALEAAVVAGYAAVVEPVEGTVLSVAAAAARGAVDAGSDEPAVVTSAALRAAELALEDTTAQLAALAMAGVVDAGGRGLVVMLEVLDAVARGEALDLSAPSSPRPVVVAGEQAGWEIQYLLDVDADADVRIAGLRTRLTAVGDSVVVACADPGDGSKSVWTVHVHGDDIGAALEAGLDAGRPHGVVVTPLIAGARPAVPTVAPGADRAVVALVPGAGLAELFAAAGAVPVDGAGLTVDALVDVLGRTGAAEVVLLPNDGAHAAVAEAASAAAGPGRTVSVLHTRSPVQGIAALAVAAAARPFREDVVAMAEAAAATRSAEVVVADRAGLTIVGPCDVGDVLALVDGDVVAIGADVAGVAADLLDRLLNAGGELVTLVLGAAAPPTLGDALAAHLRTRWPFCEVHVLTGGQPRAALLIGVE